MIKFIALIPARGGSKGIPKKNILEIDTSAEDSTFSGHLAITGSTLQTYQSNRSNEMGSFWH